MNEDDFDVMKGRRGFVRAAARLKNSARTNSAAQAMGKLRLTDFKYSWALESAMGSTTSK